MIKKEIYKKNDRIVARKVAGETILVPVKGDIADMQKIFSLNKVGSFIWDMIDGKRSLKDIREELISKFNVDEGVAEADLREFIRELVKEDLILVAE